MIARIIGRDAGLFLDLAAYSIITEDNAGQYYPDYAYNHALFTDGMKVYSDSKVSDFLRDVTIEQRIRFLNDWNAKRDHREKIYISYDSTNKKSQAGEIDMVELGHSKDGIEEEIFNLEMLKGADNEYNLDYAITAAQKTILSAFGMTVDDIRRQASALSSDLKRIETEAFERQAAIRAEGSM